MARKKGYITQQAKRLSAGEINRRRFVMQALSVGVTLPTAMSLASRAEAMTPRKGGLLRLATGEGSALDTLDPVFADNAFSRHMIRARGNTLTEIDRDGHPAPSLAESFEPSGGASTWVFTLRRGVTFHNGKPLKPADVIASLNRFRPAILAEVTGIAQDGDHQVVVSLAHDNADFPRLVSDPRLMILPSEDGAILDPDTPIGTGGYVLTEFRPGEIARFVRNADYWKSDAAHFEAVELVSIPQSSTRHRAILNGDVHFADGIDPNAVGVIRTMPTLEIYEVAGNRSLGFPVHFGDNGDHTQLQLALKHALRRQELLDQIVLGHGRIGDDTPDAPMQPLTCPFDPLLAARHYRLSGHKGPILLGTSHAGLAGLDHAARMIAASASEAGLLIEPVDTLDRPDATLIPIWANDIYAHARTLARAPRSSPNIIESWWFS